MSVPNRGDSCKRRIANLVKNRRKGRIVAGDRERVEERSIEIQAGGQRTERQAKFVLSSALCPLLFVRDRLTEETPLSCHRESRAGPEGRWACCRSGSPRGRR